MLRKSLIMVSMLSVFHLSTAAVFAADQDEAYGWQLMTEQERVEHRETMRSLKTHEEREAYRKAHHEKMQERAEERGVDLPEDPQERGRGRGSGSPDSRGGGGRGR